MSGILTGKYNDGVPEGSRLTQPGYEWLQQVLAQHRSVGVIDKVRKLSAFATDTLQCSMTQLALAWCLRNPNVSTVLLGATKVSQLEENLGAIEVARRLTPAMMDQIDEILDNRPAAYGGYGGSGMRGLDSL